MAVRGFGRVLWRFVDDYEVMASAVASAVQGFVSLILVSLYVVAVVLVDGDGVRRASRCIICDGREACALVGSSLVVRGLDYKL